MSFKKTCSSVLMSFPKTMFFCLTAACVVRFGDRTSYSFLNTLMQINTSYV